MLPISIANHNFAFVLFPIVVFPSPERRPRFESYLDLFVVTSISRLLPLLPPSSSSSSLPSSHGDSTLPDHNIHLRIWHGLSFPFSSIFYHIRTVVLSLSSLHSFLLAISTLSLSHPPLIAYLLYCSPLPDTHRLSPFSALGDFQR
jgi:hypothetical protein